MTEVVFMEIENRTILLGDDAEEFFKSDLGRYVLESALEEINLAVTKLKTVSPWDTNAIIELQTKIRIAEAAPGWLNDAIRAGRERLELRQVRSEEY